MDILKPFLMLACVGFVVGFMGFLAMAQITPPAMPGPSESWSQTVSAPAPDLNNPGKLI